MWIAYLLLLSSALCLTGMSLIRKQYQREAGGALISTTLFMAAYSFVIVIIGTIAVWILGGDMASLFAADWLVVLFAAILSVTITITTVICIVGSAYGSISILNMMATLGTLSLSSVYGLLFDRERNTLNVFTVLGLALAVLILILSVVEKPTEGKDEREKRGSWIYKILCIIIFFSNGIALVIYNMLNKYRTDYGNIEFIVLYSFFALCLCCMLLVCFRRKKAPMLLEKGTGKKGKILCLIGGYAVLFACGELCSLFCTGLLPIVVQAPLSFVFPLIILTVFDCIIFKAKITKRNLIQMLLAVVTSVMFVL